MNLGGIADGQPVAPFEAPVEGAGEDSEALITPEGLHSATLQATSFSSKIFKPRMSFYVVSLQDVEKLYGLGPFGAANFLRIWMHYLGYPWNLQLSWAPTGPGTRAGINLLCKYPSAAWLPACFFLWIGRFFFGKPAPN